MIPRSEVEAAHGWSETSRAALADGGRLDWELRRGALAMMAAPDEAERAAYRDAVADVADEVRRSAAEAGRIASDGMWRASFGSEPAAHTNEVGHGLAHDEVFRRAGCLFDGTGDPAAFSRDVRLWLSGEFAKSYDWAMGDSQRAARDAEVRYAHVPASPKPCEDCCAIAANGFVYKKPFRLHSSCKCVIVPGHADTEVEGYDPEEYYRLYRDLERVNGMELPEAAKKALRAAHYDARSVYHAAYGRLELDELFERGSKSVRKKFLSARKHDRAAVYRATMQPFMEEFGRAYGFEFSGELFFSPKGAAVGAFPDGKELSAAAIYARRYAGDSPIKFNATHETRMPDLLVDGHYVDIKTPESASGAKTRLKGGLPQLEAVKEEEIRAIVDLSYVADGEETQALDNIRELVAEGKYDKVYVIDSFNIETIE